MAGATSPDNIWFLNGSDPAPGPHTLTGLLSGSVQAAFSQRQIKTYKWPTLVALNAQTGMTYGDMGYCQENNIVYRYSVTTGNWDPVSATDLLPDPLIAIGTASGTIGGTAGVFGALGGISTASFGALTRDLLVDVRYNAIVATTTTASYARIGVAVSGGVTIAADTDSFGNSWPGLTPFSVNVDQLPAYGSKMVIIPAGSSSTFTFQAMRSVASGTQIANYATMQLIPVRWYH
jgi:hypothetical protein